MSNAMKLCISLDLPSAQENLALVEQIKDFDVWLKVGFRTYIRDGKKFLEDLKAINPKFKIFLDLILVPGAFEIPFALEKALSSKKYDAVCCVGAVIRGATPHFDYISAEATKGIATVGIKHGVPVSNGVLTTDTIEQAIERAGSKAGNKGAEAMVTIIEMLDLYNEMGK